MLRKLMVGIAIVLLAGVATAGAFRVARHLLRTKATLARQAGQPLPVRVATAKRITLTEKFGAHGVVQAGARFRVAATMSERVEAVHADLGEVVQRGTVLLQFDHELLQAALVSARTVMEQGRGDLERAQTNLQRMHGEDMRDLFSQVARDKAQAAVEEARVRYRRAQEEVLRTQKALQDARVVSPASGVVMERAVNVGEVPQRHQDLFVIGRIDTVVVETPITEERLGHIRPGMPARITFQAWPNATFRGEVVRIKPQADTRQRTLVVDVKVDNPQHRLKPGLSGFVQIERQHETLAIPNVALLQPTGAQESAVFVVHQGTMARLLPVKVGIVAEGMTEIRAGLAVGDSVVVVGQLHLQDGDHVRIGDEFTPPGPTMHGQQDLPLARIARLLGL